MDQILKILRSKRVGLLLFALGLAFVFLNDRHLSEQREQETARPDFGAAPPCRYIDLRNPGFSMFGVSMPETFKFDLGSAAMAAQMIQALSASPADSAGNPAPSALGIAVLAAAGGMSRGPASRDRAAFETHDDVCSIVDRLDRSSYCADSEVDEVMRRLTSNRKGFPGVLSSTPGCRSDDEQCWIDFRFRSWYGVSHDEFIDQVAMACRAASLQTADASCSAYNPTAEGDLHVDFIGKYFNDLGSRAQPLAASLCFDALLRRPSDGCARVIGLIIGRRPVGNECQVLVRTDASKSVSGMKAAWAARWENSSEVWIPESNLYLNVLRIEILKATGDALAPQGTAPPTPPIAQRRLLVY